MEDRKREIKTDVADMELRDIANGTVRFSIKADDTLENLQVHSAFKEFCKIETDNNYTQGLKKLLEYYQSDYKIEMIYSMIQEQNIVINDIKGSITDLKSQPKKVEEDDSEAF